MDLDDFIFEETLRNANSSNISMRLVSIEFKNFRNIQYGELCFPNSAWENIYSCNSSILGLYGPNGSGKSSVIMALDLLKCLLCGKKLGNKFDSCIQYGFDTAKISYSFRFISSTEFFDDVAEENYRENTLCYSIEYSVELTHINKSRRKGICVETERVAVSIKNMKDEIIFPKNIIFDTAYDSCEKGRIPFGNKMNFFSFMGNKSEDNSLLEEIMLSKKHIKMSSRSFVFSNEFENYLEMEKIYEAYLMYCNILKRLSNVKDEPSVDLRTVIIRLKNLILKKYNCISEEYAKELMNDSKAFEIEMLSNMNDFNYVIIAFGTLSLLLMYGKNYLHIVDTTSTGRINLNRDLPLFHLAKIPETDFYGASLVSYIRMNKISEMRSYEYGQIESSIRVLNIVLEKIVPSLNIQIRTLGERTDENDDAYTKYELLAKRGEVTIPLRYESDGVRRIVSILSLMIATYNNESVLLAIDEFDSGIFEYLLGEIVGLLNETGKGQVIFTSHNLRPLEVLPSQNICFTTTDPFDRFSFVSRKGNGNLRDAYYRNIMLGSEKYSLSYDINKYELENAFIRAGMEEQEL